MKKLMKMAVGAWCWVLAAGVAQAELVEYRDYDAATGTFTNAVRECTLVSGATRTLADGWYAVQGKVTIPEGPISRSPATHISSSATGRNWRLGSRLIFQPPLP